VASKRVVPKRRRRKSPVRERIGLRAYARRRGVTLAAVQRAIAEERITRGKDGKIDPARADREWERNSRPRPDGSAGDSIAGINRQKAQAELELKLLDLAQRRGQLIPLEIHERRFAEFVGRVRAALRGLRGRWPAHLIGIETLQEGQIRLDPLITELLNELAGVPAESERGAA